MADSIRIPDSCNPDVSPKLDTPRLSPDRVYNTFHVSPALRQKAHEINLRLQKEQVAARTRAYHEAKPEQQIARIATTRAIAAGLLVRPKTCQECGASGRIAAHHPDYSKPLDVEWLCRSCHSYADAQRRVREWGGPQVSSEPEETDLAA